MNSWLAENVNTLTDHVDANEIREALFHIFKRILHLIPHRIGHELMSGLRQMNCIKRGFTASNDGQKN